MTDEPLNEDMLRDLQKRTEQLPREIEPPADAWVRIRAQIEMESEARIARPASREKTFWQRPALLAAAALLLIAGTSLVTAMVIGRRAIDGSGRNVAGLSRATVSSSSNGGDPATLAEFAAVENDYIGTANSLSAAIESGSAGLSPETIAKLRASLRIIDAAILEARRALAADPANRTLIELLSTSYSQKVDLLRRTTEMGQS